ncbi:MAG TPA: EVE domain-containing protein [Longimicrobiales bacterium]|nr:EVE domain-containing protein [Longimicrobiales bacterium]
MMANAWVFLADPKDYGWDELEKAGSAVWDGVKNAQAQRHMQACEEGDTVLIYHTAPDKAIIGIARVSGEHRPDPNAADRVVVDVEPVKKLARTLPLAELKADDVLSGMSFVRMPRVAVQRVTEEQLKRVLQLSGTRLQPS